MEHLVAEAMVFSPIQDQTPNEHSQKILPGSSEHVFPPPPDLTMTRPRDLT